MKKIFLGGTCNNSKWRERIIPFLEEHGIAYFNPVVRDWTPECQKMEERIKGDPDTVNLFVITKEMTGVFSIAEAVDSSNKFPARTIFCFFEDGFTEAQIKSLHAVGCLIKKNFGFYLSNCGLSSDEGIKMLKWFLFKFEL